MTWRGLFYTGFKRLLHEHLAATHDDDAAVAGTHLLSGEVVAGSGKEAGGVGGGGSGNGRVQGALEFHLVDVAVRIGDGEAQDLLALGQVARELALHDLVGVPSAGGRYGDLGELGDGGSLDQADGESSVGAGAVGAGGIEGVLAGLCYAHGVFRPLALGGVADGRASVALDEIQSLVVVAVLGVALVVVIAVVEGECLASLVEVLCLDDAGQDDGAALVGYAFAVDFQGLPGRRTGLAEGVCGHGHEGVGSLLGGLEIEFVGFLGEGSDEEVVGVHADAGDGCVLQLGGGGEADERGVAGGDGGRGDGLYGGHDVCLVLVVAAESQALDDESALGDVQARRWLRFFIVS